LEGGAVDSEHEEALSTLVRQLNSVKQDVILERGDALYIDNYRTLHGRAPYTAKYDGTGRWLKRIYISGSIRRSRKLRSDAASRIIEGEEV
jgi:alpha-ketoglutarate-dependent taurine dioxygenase